MHLNSNNYKLYGTWFLDHYQITDEQGQNILLWGPNASGLLIYTENGYMSVQVSNENRPSFIQNDFLAGNVDEIKAAFEGYTAYFGRYDYQEQNGFVYHFVKQSVFPNWNGVTHTRYVSLEKDQLVLSTPPVTIKGTPCKMYMYWKKNN